MNAIAEFIQQCHSSGELLLALAATLALPFFAWILTRPVVAFMRGSGAPRFRGLVFATLAIAPGLSFAAGTPAIVIAAYRTGCLNWTGGRAMVATIVSIFALSVLRAAVLAIRRNAEVGTLRATARTPGVRLSEIARHAGLPVMQIRSQQPILCLVGIRRPVVLVSDSALECLTEDELRAALAHERAHARHFDHLLMTIVAFFADLLPMPVNDLIARYRVAREFAADRAALASTEALDLAQAMYRLASPRPSTCGAALADRALASRVRALLEPNAADDGHIVRNLSLLIACQGPIAVAFIALVLALSTCRMVA